MSTANASGAKEARLESLKAKHSEIDQHLHEEEGRPLPDVVEIKRLKVEKLRLKEEMSRLAE